MFALVDIDNTLWDFGAEMTRRLRELFPAADIIDNPSYWEYPLQFFPHKEDAYAFFRSIHEDQCLFSPFDDAQELLIGIKNQGLKIHIASNRNTETQGELIRWLDLHDLPFDKIYCGPDKRTLLQNDLLPFEFVFDDSPEVHEACIQAGIPVVSLEFGYNEGNPHVAYYRTLKEIAGDIRVKGYYDMKNII